MLRLCLAFSVLDNHPPRAFLSEMSHRALSMSSSVLTRGVDQVSRGCIFLPGAQVLGLFQSSMARPSILVSLKFSLSLASASLVINNSSLQSHFLSVSLTFASRCFFFIYLCLFITGLLFFHNVYEQCHRTFLIFLNNYISIRKN